MLSGPRISLTSRGFPEREGSVGSVAEKRSHTSILPIFIKTSVLDRYQKVSALAADFCLASAAGLVSHR